MTKNKPYTIFLLCTHTSTPNEHELCPFETLTDAQKFAIEFLGTDTPELIDDCATSYDGLRTIDAEGVSLSELFPASKVFDEDA